jgi:hypothetical protein
MRVSRTNEREPRYSTSVIEGEEYKQYLGNVWFEIKYYIGRWKSVYEVGRRGMRSNEKGQRFEWSNYRHLGRKRCHGQNYKKIKFD